MLTYNIDLDVAAGARPEVIYLKQYQTDVSLVFKLYTTSGTLSIGTVTDCSIRGTKGDGNGYSVTASYSSSNQTVTAHATTQMTAAAGKAPFELTLTDSSGKMITATFYINVIRSALDEDTISASQIREITNALDHSAEIIQAYNEASYDNVPTQNSDHAVKSGGIYTALAYLLQTIQSTYQPLLSFDSSPTANSENPVTSVGIYSAIENAKVTFDNVPTENSNNAVKSGGVYEAIANIRAINVTESNGDVVISYA